ncbi:hypothetical protein C1701_20625 [Actinoalloteichus sp. AHMU CJ021]|uniref:hypothetical protein n=1 Tax=Actinoalloteichus TaxID=65496 RepID=UPI0004AAD802|nr:hypothetical protein [Actinoalloteichus caeruleus]AUS80344.1 hypothetical protein C1701_20625 [Actinoalloteichus sp. AHMU CJ021]
MRNSSRHITGAVLGVLLTPAIGWGLGWASGELVRAFRVFDVGVDLLLPSLVIVAIGLAIAVLTSERVSPVAALVPGVAFLAAGLLFMVSTGTATRVMGWLGSVSPALISLASFGLLLLLGTVLVASALMPGRWREPGTTGPAVGDGIGGHPGAPFPRPEDRSPWGTT